ncbi:MAG: Xaa-Pro peptidase family protein [Phycisphaerales bacterium]|nr:Xaa-Pro peptidase family protein [Phycisphaerales bacterium]
MTIQAITSEEMTARRAAVMTALDGSVAVVFASDPSAAHAGGFRPHPHFEYLTGIIDEPGALLILDPGSLDPRRRVMLFLQPRNPEAEHWDGYRDPINAAMRTATGIDAIYRLGSFPTFLNQAVRRSKSLACLHPFALHTQPPSPDLALFNEVCQRICGTQIVDRTEVLANLRATKSESEIAIIQQAVDITATGYDAVMRSVKPGMNESDVQTCIEHAYLVNGGQGPAYDSIVGAGINSTVLHYIANNQPIADGDLICIDSGTRLGSCNGGYAADITRTIPANGKFTDRQREIYEIVLEAELAAIAIARAGVTFTELNQAARGVIEKAGYGNYLVHGIGHHLGLEVHDITPEGPLKAGAIITIEPGIYLPDEKIGIRIEDDILITDSGSKNLSEAIPKSIDDIERLMADR